MLCEKFAESWFNGTHYLARRQLRPFCLWHYTYLQFVKSPMIPWGPGGDITWAEIEQTSRICQLRYPQQLDTSPQRLRLFVTMAKCKLADEIDAFSKYVKDYFSPPMFNEWQSEKPLKKKGGPPDTLSVASAVIMMFGGGPPTEKFVWEMPIGKAYWYASTLHYNRGAGLDYMTARDEEWRQFLRKQRAEGKI